jgi:glycosyltransferase involved in cell wall biosynthesis
MTPADVSLVVPVYNEEVRLQDTLARLTALAEEAQLSLQIIVADDGSTDRTVEVFDDWSRSHGAGRVTCALVRLAHRGKGAAVRAGMKQAAARIVGYSDADLSAGPDAILKLLGVVRAGADMAMASRGLQESVLAKRQPWYREFAGRALNLGLRTLAGIPFRDTQCGLKLFRADAAREIFRHQRLDGFAFDIELVLVAMRFGFRIEEVPIVWEHATGSKVSILRDPLKMARDTMRVMRRLRREAFYTPGVPSADAMARMTGVEDAHWWHAAKRKIIADQLDAAPRPRRCLDIGCGGGAMLARAADFGPVVGTDLSLEALRSARGRGLQALVRAEAAALPFATATCSTVLALDVIEHHAQPEEMLKEISRVLMKGGLLIVTVPAFDAMWSYADDVLGHYRRYTRPQLADELRSAGFTVRRVTYFHSWLLPVAWIFRMLRTVLRRTESADDFQVPALMNRLLSAICALERRRLSRGDLPFGLSLLAVAEKSGRASLELEGARLGDRIGTDAVGAREQNHHDMANRDPRRESGLQGRRQRRA